MALLYHCCAWLLLASHGDSDLDVHFDPPTVQLTNGRFWPLVGLGVGNLAHDKIDHVVTVGVRDNELRLIDTAAASRNEEMIANAVTRGAPLGAHVDVLTKVWYTHLGFNRTLLSVRDSLEALKVGGVTNVSVTVLIHWPRCRPDIAWMRCADEEAELSARVKDTGPPPHMDPEGAWRGSWRALESLYVSGKIANIGVSNFDVHDMSELLAFAEVRPHVLQANVWSFVFDPNLMNLLQEHHVALQVYNVMNGILTPARLRADGQAHDELRRVAAELSSGAQGSELDVSTVVLKWLTQQGVGVIPRAASLMHVRVNSPAYIAALPRMENSQLERVKHAVQKLLRAEEKAVNPEESESQAVVATFVNAAHTSDMRVFWQHPETSEEIEVIERLPAGGQATLSTHPGHMFVARVADSHVKVQTELLVTKRRGEHQTFQITPSEEL